MIILGGYIMAINQSMINAFERVNNSNYVPKLHAQDEAVQFLLAIQNEIFRDNNADNLCLMTTKLVHMLSGKYPYEIQR
jgi:hypothetical protein